MRRGKEAANPAQDESPHRERAARIRSRRSGGWEADNAHLEMAANTRCAAREHRHASRVLPLQHGERLRRRQRAGGMARLIRAASHPRTKRCGPGGNKCSPRRNERPGCSASESPARRAGLCPCARRRVPARRRSCRRSWVVRRRRGPLEPCRSTGLAHLQLRRFAPARIARRDEMFLLPHHRDVEEARRLGPHVRRGTSLDRESKCRRVREE